MLLLSSAETITWELFVGALGRAVPPWCTSLTLYRRFPAVRVSWRCWRCAPPQPVLRLKKSRQTRALLSSRVSEPSFNHLRTQLVGCCLPQHTHTHTKWKLSFKTFVKDENDEGNGVCKQAVLPGRRSRPDHLHPSAFTENCFLIGWNIFQLMISEQLLIQTV